jgi:DNA invertase Pin-like site-specific DNA recombinase
MGSVLTITPSRVTPLQRDPDDPIRTAMRQMMGVFAQLERSMIAAQLRHGMAPSARLQALAAIPIGSSRRT